jgi:hypothetical protein
MLTVNEKLVDHAVAHAIDQQFYSNGVVRKIIALLNRVDADLFGQITVALERLPLESFTTERLEQLLYSVRAINAQAYRAVELELTAELRKFVEYEAGYQYQLFNSAIPRQVVAQVGIASVNVEQVYAAALSRPFQGVLLKEALSGLEAGRAKMVRDQIRIGYVENQPIAEIVKRIRGTRALKYADGFMEAPRGHLEAIVRTAISHTAGVTRDRFYEANTSVIKAEEWLSTIDSRTSPHCRIRDRLRYTPVEHKPIGHDIPWKSGPGRLHYCCRSISVPITKSWKELGGVDIEEFSPSTRASMGGEIPADTSYAEWIKRQSAARQDEILGRTRGKLMREGGLELDRFYSNKGQYLTIEELRQRDAEAFRKADL